MNKWRLKNGSTITFVGDGEELKGCRSNFGMPVGDNLTDELLWSEMFSSQSDRITFKDGQIHVSREDIWPV